MKDTLSDSSRGMVLATAGLICLIFLGCQNEQPSSTKQERIDEMYKEYKKSFPDVPDITVQKMLERKKEEELVLVDAREPQERAVSMIPDASPVTEFEKHMDQLKDRPIVVYCTIGYRSAEYTKELQKKGFDAFNMKGGILAWTHTGRPLVTDSTQTNRVHVYGEKWDLAADGYESTW